MALHPLSEPPPSCCTEPSDPGDRILSLPWSRVLAFRLERQRLVPRARATHLPTAVDDATGIQAQVLSAAQMGVGARVRNVSAKDVERALWDPFESYPKAVRDGVEEEAAALARFLEVEDHEIAVG